MRAPKRVQRTRKRGGGIPAGAVYVGRPSKWGNPFTGAGPIDHDLMKQYFQAWIVRPENAAFREEVRSELAGKDLACWCPLDKACHADVLLVVANHQVSNPDMNEEEALEQVLHDHIHAESFKAMARLARAQKRGTGCHLTASMVRSLATTDFGQLWADPD